MDPLGFIDLVHNYPLPGDSTPELLGSLASKFTRNPHAACRYLPVEALPEHRAGAAQWLSLPTYPIEPARIAFGVSGHQILSAILLGFTGSGDQIACDPTTYNGWININRHIGRRHVPIPGDGQGMLPEELEKAVRRQGIWGVFLIPSLHNPCTTVMPISRRRELVEVCRRYGLWVIDDDAYRFLAPEPAPSFAHLYPEKSFWLQSLTKPLFPSIKTALVAGPKNAMPKLTEALRISGHQPSALTVPWVLEILLSGTLDRLAADKRMEASKRQRVAMQCLGGFNVQTIETSFHLWVRLGDPWTSDSAAEALSAAGVGVVSGSKYAVDPGADPKAVRIALAGEDDLERVVVGLKRVRNVLEL